MCKLKLVTNYLCSNNEAVKHCDYQGKIAINARGAVAARNNAIEDQKITSTHPVDSGVAMLGFHQSCSFNDLAIVRETIKTIFPSTNIL